ncbi:MAG: thioredoxin domain-containing protein, partial [Bacteroidota bacterium]|nr:thioredoxin domain-containing protein [Bacteroidota bacterium]
MEKEDNANRLARESSPYLLAHAYNPVDWYPWGNEALQKAEKEHKLLIISIGYSSCHWCHVMEKESFNDPEVADVMNRFYVSVKVDREERPDIDQIYMTAAYIVQGTGGWPLNVIALPDGRPFFAGSYFPKERWIYVLEQFALLQQHEPQQLEEYAAKITSHIRTPDISPDSFHPLENSLSELKKELDPLKNKFDPEYGGLKGSPKFPMPSLLQMLLTMGFKLRDAELDQHVKITLVKMAIGGIHDHVGGGFARYSVDPWWKVPHFEKMLYDNAQLLKLYAQAYARWKDPLFLNVCKQIVSFAQRGLHSPEGAYYASFDADSNGEEGQYYCWSKIEIDSLLGNDTDAFCEIFQVTEAGNRKPDKNILIRKDAKLDKRIADWLKILLEARNQRVPPALDDKILTSWNALMITGLCELAKVTGEDYYTSLACKTATFIKEKMILPDGMIRHTYKNGESSIHGFLDDYAFTIEAFLALYEVTAEEKWILRAQQLNLYTLSHFQDPESRLF